MRATHHREGFCRGGGGTQREYQIGEIAHRAKELDTKLKREKQGESAGRKNSRKTEKRDDAEEEEREEEEKVRPTRRRRFRCGR